MHQDLVIQTQDFVSDEMTDATEHDVAVAVSPDVIILQFIVKYDSVGGLEVGKLVRNGEVDRRLDGVGNSLRKLCFGGSEYSNVWWE
jgi:hypothetical protein